VRLLGDLVVAAIVHGSLVLGDFRPGRSDVDLLVVVERPLADGELDAICNAMVARRDSAPGGIDVRVVTRHIAAFPTPEPAMELYVGLHGDEEPEILMRVVEPDLVAELSIARADGRSLVGAEPTRVIGDVPDDWVVAYGDASLARWERLTDDAQHAELMVLTSCRVWRYALEGVHCSKSEAGRWALARDPSLAAVTGALRLRAGDANAVVEPGDVAALIEVVRGAIRERAGAAGAT